MTGFTNHFATDAVDGNTSSPSLGEVQTVGLHSGRVLPQFGSSADSTQAASAGSIIGENTAITPDPENRKEPKSHKSKNGKNKKSDPETDKSDYTGFRRHCDDILAQTRELEQLIDDKGNLGDGWEGPVVEIKALLMSLRSVRWGQGDSLKRWVTTLWFQIANTTLDARHVKLLRDATQALRIRYVVDSTAVDECAGLVVKHGFDQFRGTATEPVVKIRYKTVPAE